MRNPVGLLHLAPSKQCLPLFMVLLFIGAIGCPPAAGTSQDGGTAEDAGVDLSPSAQSPCSVDGWCWQFPSLQGNTLRAVWSGTGEKWAVGDAGTALHFQGGSSGSWQFVALPTRLNLHAVWGGDNTHVWAVGDMATILRWDGSTWSRVAFSQNRQDLYAVWGSANNDVWFAGASGVLLHWDGSTVTQRETTTPKALLRGLWGTSSNDVYAAGFSLSAGVGVPRTSTVLHWDGSNWSTFPTPPDLDISSVWGHAAIGVFFGTLTGAIYLHDGKSWNIVNPSSAGNAIEGGWATSDRSVFAVGGVQYPTMGDPIQRKGTFLKWNGTRFVDINEAPPAVGLFGVTADSARDITAVGQSGTVVRFNDAGFTSSGTLEPLTGVGATMRGVTGGTEFDLVSVGDFGANLQYDGSTWKALPRSVYERFLSVSGTSPNLLSVSINDTIRSSLIQRFAAGAWITELTSTTLSLTSIFSCPDGALAAGSNEVVLVRSGSSWTQRAVQTPVPNNVLRAVWMSGTTMWAVGGGDYWEKTDMNPAAALVATGGGNFTRTTLPYSDRILRGVWGTAPNNVYAVGDGGLVLRWDGMAWQTQPTPPLGNILRGVFGRSVNDIYVVGDGGMILHFDGSAWTLEDSGTNVRLHSVFVLGKSIYVTGDNGSILRKLTP